MSTRSKEGGVRLSIAGAAKETGALLREYLVDRGVYDEAADAVVCYGQPTTKGSPQLNGSCGTSKVDRLMMMQAASVLTVPWFTGSDIPVGIKFPLLARRARGYGGEDIVPVFQEEEVQWRVAAGWDWFSEYVPITEELRVWVFRGECLDVYQKVMRRPEEFKYIGRNFRNGFDFKWLSGRQGGQHSAACAVEAVDLDFGAVDLIIGRDGKEYVLEVNSAPGVIRSGAEITLGRLADCIAEWGRRG